MTPKEKAEKMIAALMQESETLERKGHHTSAVAARHLAREKIEHLATIYDILTKK